MYSIKFICNIILYKKSQGLFDAFFGRFWCCSCLDERRSSPSWASAWPCSASFGSPSGRPDPCGTAASHGVGPARH